MKADSIIPAKITRMTPLTEAGEVARDLMREATFQIEGLSLSIVELAEELCSLHEQNPPAKFQAIRASALRVRRLNEFLMGHFGCDDQVPLYEVNIAVNGREVALEGVDRE